MSCLDNEIVWFHPNSSTKYILLIIYDFVLVSKLLQRQSTSPEKYLELFFFLKYEVLEIQYSAKLKDLQKLWCKDFNLYMYFTE